MAKGTDLFVHICTDVRVGGGAHVFSTDTGLSTAGAHAYSFRKVFPANLYPSSGPVSVSGGGGASQSGRGGVLWVFPEHSVGVSSRQPRCVDVLVQVLVHVCVLNCIGTRAHILTECRDSGGPTHGLNALPWSCDIPSASSPPVLSIPIACPRLRLAPLRLGARARLWRRGGRRWALRA